MKKAIFLSICLLFVVGPLAAQSVCRSQLINYSGPHNTSELATKLNTSTNLVIVGLSYGLKQALIDHAVFENGFPRGIDESNNYIADLFQSNSAAGILSAIFDCPGVMCSATTKPVYPTMSMTDFLAMYSSDPVKYTFTSFMTTCYNCYFGKGDCCCYTGGNGCWDIAIEITSTGQHLYVIQD